MATNDPWGEFETLRHWIKQNTVDRLKAIINGFQDECSSNIAKGGRKQELIDRITQQMDFWRQTNNVERWIKGRAVLHQVRTSGIYNHRHSMPGPSGNVYAANVQNGFRPSTSNVTRFDPYAPPRQVSTSSSVGASAPQSSRPTMKFRPSPFFRADQAISNIIECPESLNSTDRKQQSATFTLSPDHVQKLSSLSPKYQLRLFCTSSTFYSSGPAFRAQNEALPIEFPPTCEVRVNNVQLQANLKGLKKKPGTAPPADLGRSVKHTGPNRVEMVYVNSQQPIQPKRYYLIIMLVEVASVDQLVERLMQNKYRTQEEIMDQLSKVASQDDDIVAGPQRMSLKCPLSFMRVNSPCRSILCVHPQCFDATSWFSMMEQTTTWLCPVCERVLNYEDLIIDGYFDHILRSTPESVEDVMVESDGQWHTSDNKYASDAWRVTHPLAVQSSPARAPSPSASVDEELEAKRSIKQQQQQQQQQRQNIEVMVLDSDDEDEGRVKRELSVSHGSSASASRPYVINSSPQAPSTRASVQNDVIDLTVESDDESPPQPSIGTKRSAPDHANSPTEGIWKKSRLGSIPPATGPSLRPAESGQATGPSNSLVTSPNAHRPPFQIDGMQYRPHAGQAGRDAPARRYDGPNATYPPYATSSPHEGGPMYPPIPTRPSYSHPTSRSGLS